MEVIREAYDRSVGEPLKETGISCVPKDKASRLREGLDKHVQAFLCRNVEGVFLVFAAG